MPYTKVRGGYKIRREKGGMYPKVYKTIKGVKERIDQMERHK